MSEELKLTPFQQRFVDFRAQGKSQGDAYILAGGKGNEKNINRLAWRTDNHPKVKEALNRAATVAFERNVGSIEYIIEECVAIVKEAREGGAKTLGPAVAALNLLAKRFPEFRDPVVDARQVNLVVPEGTSIDDIRSLRDQLRGSSS